MKNRLLGRLGTLYRQYDHRTNSYGIMGEPPLPSIEDYKAYEPVLTHNGSKVEEDEDLPF